jgi:hypothetical protein
VWFYDEDTTILTITGSGDMANFDSRDMLPPWANYRDSIKKVVISDGVTNIANYAFYNCTALKDITIGKNVATIDYTAFLGCSALESITVDENNASYLSEDGILFSKDKTKIIRYPQGKAGEYSIPKDVKTIGAYAFRDCALLTSVTIPEGVTTIEEFAFFNALGLRHIYISKSVTNIRGKYIFGTKDEQQIFLCEWYLVVGGETGSELEKWCDRYGVNFYPLQEKELRDFLALPLPELHPYPAGKDTYLAGSRKIAQEKENAKRQKQ